MDIKTSYNFLNQLYREHSNKDNILSFSVHLTIMAVIYIVLAILLTALVSYVKKSQYVEEINRYSNSKRTGDRMFLWHFIFLQLCILFRLVNVIILLLHAFSYSSSSGSVKVWIDRISYNVSSVFLCVAYSILLYEWFFIILRVKLYGNVFSVEEFK